MVPECISVPFVVVPGLAIIAICRPEIIAYFNIPIYYHVWRRVVALVSRAFAIAQFAYFIDASTMPAFGTFANIFSDAVRTI